jgi:hypothetical protein
MWSGKIIQLGQASRMIGLPDQSDLKKKTH